jgi:hypothetical protein
VRSLVESMELPPAAVESPSGTSYSAPPKKPISKNTWRIAAALVAVLTIFGIGAGLMFSKQNAALARTNVAITKAREQARADQDAAKAAARAASITGAADAAAAAPKQQASALAKAEADAAAAKAMAGRAQAPKVVVRPTYRPSQVTDLSAGLFCRDLKSMGYSYSEALSYWYWYWYCQPANMDADLNGIPCQTMY